jgi:hypothetical protein
MNPLCPFAMCPALPDSDYYGHSVPLPGRRPTTGLPRRPHLVSAYIRGRTAVPTFTANRSIGEVPAYAPAASPRLRRRPSSWPSKPTSLTGPEVVRRAARSRPPHQTRTASQPRSTGFELVSPLEELYNGGSSRTPSDLACQAPAVRQCRRALSLSGLLSAFPGVSRVRLPPASPACCDRPAVESFHLHSVLRRLVAHGAVAPRSPHPSHDRSSAATSATRTRSSLPRRPVAATRPITMAWHRPVIRTFRSPLPYAIPARSRART